MRSMPQEIALAYSADADDAFMFYALRAGRIDTRGLVFRHRRGDTAELNALAATGGADVVAISAGAYPEAAGQYLLLPHGASVGRGFGPAVVARRPVTLAALQGRRVAVPGLSTTAWLVLRLMQPGLVPVVMPIVPFGRAFDALDAGEVEAALLIHEGRLLYEERGYVQVAEIGQWWQAATRLPLPLGVNVVRRSLGSKLIRIVSDVLRDAIAYALANRTEVIAALASESRGDQALARSTLLDRYLAMYANEDTRKTAPDVSKAIGVLFERARAAGLLSNDFAVEWA